MEWSEAQVYRFGPDGRLDTAFGTGGVARSGDQNWTGGGGELLVRPDGGFVIVGPTDPGLEVTGGHRTDFDAAGRVVAEADLPGMLYGGTTHGALLADGTVAAVADGYFGTQIDLDGVSVPYAFNEPGAARDAVVADDDLPGLKPEYGPVWSALGTPDDRLLVATGGGNAVAVGRVRADGSPDPTFGFGGTSVFRFDPYHDGWAGEQSVTGMTLLPGGDAILAGRFRGRLLLARVEGGAHAVPADAAPRAALVPYIPDPTHTDPPKLLLRVEYFGVRPIDAATLDDQDVLLEGPSGAGVALGKIAYVTPTFAGGGDGTPVYVDYDFPYSAAAFAPGRYTVDLVGRVADVGGRAVPGGPVGRFDWPAPSLERPAPADAPFVAELMSGYGATPGQAEVTFSVRLTSPAGVDVSTLDDANFWVERADRLRAAARFVSVRRSWDGRTAVATYAVAAPGGVGWGVRARPDALDGGALSEGHYTIYTGASPRDLAGHTIDGYFRNTLGRLGDFVAGWGRCPTAELVSAAPIADRPGGVRVEVRMTPGEGAEVDLSSLQGDVIELDPVAAPRPMSPNLMELVATRREPDGSVVATYEGAAPAGAPPGPLGIRIRRQDEFYGHAVGPRDAQDRPIPAGLVGTVNPAYAGRRPVASLLTVRATPGRRGYVEVAVRYNSFRGLQTPGTVLLHGPGGLVTGGVLVGLDATEPTSVVARYQAWVPAGAGPEWMGRYYVSVQLAVDRDGRNCRPGTIGFVRVSWVLPAPAPMPARAWEAVGTKRRAFEF